MKNVLSTSVTWVSNQRLHRQWLMNDLSTIAPSVVRYTVVYYSCSATYLFLATVTTANYRWVGSLLLMQIIIIQGEWQAHVMCWCNAWQATLYNINNNAIATTSCILIYWCNNTTNTFTPTIKLLILYGIRRSTIMHRIERVIVPNNTATECLGRVHRSLIDISIGEGHRPPREIRWSFHDPFGGGPWLRT